MQIKAKMLEIFEIQQVTNTFKKREFVVEYAENPQYPEFLKFELIQDKCDILDDFSIGQEVEVHFNLKAHAPQFHHICIVLKSSRSYRG